MFPGWENGRGRNVYDAMHRVRIVPIETSVKFHC